MSDVDELEVCLHDLPAGRLQRGRRGGVLFVSMAAFSISATVPPGEPWTAERTAAWFEGLLPEGEMRSRLASRFGISASDTFAMLGAVGWECAGAISVLPAGRRPATGSYLPLSAADVGERLDALPGRPFDSDAAVRASLGGVQSKLVLATTEAGWAEPLDGAPSTHILKPEPPQWPGMAAAEVWAMRVARSVTPTADAELTTTLGRRPTVVVRRFDRERVGAGIRRSHQEDLCQLLGLPPDAKYTEPPLKPWQASLGRLAGLLRDRGVDPTTELRHLVEQMTVSVGLLNADAHAKNYSVLHGPGGTVRLAPAYDVVPTVPFLPTQTHAALPVAGKFRLDEITSAHLVREAVGWGIPERIARSSVDESIELLRSAVDAPSDLPVDEAIVRAVRDQVRRLSASPDR